MGVIRHHTRLALAALAAALVLAAAASSASAGRFSLTETGFRMVWHPAQFILEFPTVSFAVVCDLTLEGSFYSRTFRKLSGSELGLITRATVPRPGGCETAGQVTILPNSLPWHLIYESFSGSLPIITRIFFKIPDAAFSVETGLRTCLYLVEASHPVRLYVEIAREDRIRNVELDELLVSIPLMGNNCGGGDGKLRGSGRYLDLIHETETVTVRLI